MSVPDQTGSSLMSADNSCKIDGFKVIFLDLNLKKKGGGPFETNITLKCSEIEPALQNALSYGLLSTIVV